MLTTNPFATLAETIPMIAIQSFVIVMVGLVIFRHRIRYDTQKKC